MVSSNVPSWQEHSPASKACLSHVHPWSDGHEKAFHGKVIRPAPSSVQERTLRRSLLKLCICGADIKWALLRQPSASLVHIIVLKEDPGRDRDCVVEECQAEYTWKGLVHEGEEDSDEELKGLMKVSEDKRGFRALVCTQ